MVLGFDGSRAFIKDRTGTENYSYQLLKNLAKIDTENSYVVYIRAGYSSKTSMTGRPVKPVKSVNTDNTGYTDSTDYTGNWPENFKFVGIGWPRLWTQGGLALQTFKDNLDILFTPAHTLPLVRRPGLKTVMTVHDLGAEYLPSMHQLKQQLYLNFITNFQLKSASRLIAVSNATKRDLVKKVGVDPKQVRVVYEAVDQELFKSPSNKKIAEVLKKYGLKEKNYFFFVGTIQPRKNLARLIEAFSVLLKSGQLGEDFKLVLAGGKGWLSEEIYAKPIELGTKKSVLFLGRVEDSDLPALYSGATAFTFPSLFEGFGLPILEAFSCNCPVLTSNASSLPEVAGEAAVYVEPNNLNSIIQGLKQISHPKLQSELVKKGQKQLEKFSWAKTAEQTLAVFNELHHG